jgi:hypothetical protein
MSLILCQKLPLVFYKERNDEYLLVPSVFYIDYVKDFRRFYNGIDDSKLIKCLKYLVRVKVNPLTATLYVDNLKDFDNEYTELVNTFFTKCGYYYSELKQTPLHIDKIRSISGITRKGLLLVEGKVLLLPFNSRYDRSTFLNNDFTTLGKVLVNNNYYLDINENIEGLNLTYGENQFEAFFNINEKLLQKISLSREEENFYNSFYPIEIDKDTLKTPEPNKLDGTLEKSIYYGADGLFYKFEKRVITHRGEELEMKPIFSENSCAKDFSTRVLPFMYRYPLELNDEINYEMLQSLLKPLHISLRSKRV